ncbi:hypothetical protein BDW59DRAFT_116141 [Aspergillus cavernicola]|uniref:Uncharacterized protein n=1 Tax=Aspergillus cavernicola TaxID=176166 RepID=A0ABR4IWP4_9EURO
MIEGRSDNMEVVVFIGMASSQLFCIFFSLSMSQYPLPVCGHDSWFLLEQIELLVLSQ